MTGAATTPVMDLRGARKLGDQPAPAESPLTPRELALRIVYTSPEGKRHEAVAVSRIMDAADRATWNRIRTGLVRENGGDLASLPLVEQARIHAFSMIAVQLREPPEWIERWVGQDDALLMQLFEACEGHSARYFRRDAGASAEDAARSRVSIAPADAPGSGA